MPFQENHRMSTEESQRPGSSLPPTKPNGRRHKLRVAKEIPVRLSIDGVDYYGRTVLLSRSGALVYSPVACYPGTEVELTDLDSGRTVGTRVAWSWVDRGGEDRVIRLDLEVDSDSLAVWRSQHEGRVETGREAPEERRRDGRQPSKVGLLAHWRGSTQAVETVDVSRRGAGIVSEVSYQPGAVLRLFWPENAMDASFRVVWSGPGQENPPTSPRYRVGLELLDEESDSWRERGPMTRPASRP
jgi:hypothetical protein